MSVRFRATKVREEVEMTNAKARIVLELVGRDGMGYLEGKMKARALLGKLDGIRPEKVAAAVVVPRQLGAHWFDHGTSREDLDEMLGGLRRLASAALEVGTVWVRWS